ncbi:MAG: isoprenylcysteine carboxylmethyltransferase family protein [Anaerolineae bacterium]|nr:isoprenylcysteine carboxylmethyltransferase family protein [Anaerolineae bacterium]
MKESTLSKGVMTWAAKGLFAKVVVALILFLSAGRIDWTMGWVYVGIFAAFDLATALAVIPRHPDLLVERSNIQAGTKRWDAIIVRLSAAYLPMASWLVAGLDERFGWTPDLPLALQLAAVAVTVLGYALVVWAMAANAYFSTTVRIQDERGHTVVTAGPYRFVRHPGYVASITFTTSAPVMLGSLWALIPALLSAAFYIVRTALEDKTLHEELDGYVEYAQQTRYRLLPGIW